MRTKVRNLKSFKEAKTERQRTFETGIAEIPKRVKLCIAFKVREDRTLTTAQQNDSGKTSCNNQQVEVKNGNSSRKIWRNDSIGLRIKRRKNQATKSTGWMPWHHTPTKDVASCEKLRGAASRHRSVDIRMGKPGRRRTCHRKMNP